MASAIRPKQCLGLSPFIRDQNFYFYQMIWIEPHSWDLQIWRDFISALGDQKRKACHFAVKIKQSRNIVAKGVNEFLSSRSNIFQPNCNSDLVVNYFNKIVEKHLFMIEGNKRLKWITSLLVIFINIQYCQSWGSCQMWQAPHKTDTWRAGMQRCLVVLANPIELTRVGRVLLGYLSCPKW